MSVAAQFMQNGSSSNRFSQGSRFLVKELVKGKWLLSQGGSGKLVFLGSFLTKSWYELLLLVKA